MRPKAEGGGAEGGGDGDTVTRVLMVGAGRRPPSFIARQIQGMKACGVEVALWPEFRSRRFLRTWLCGRGFTFHLPREMLAAARAVTAMGGGLAVTHGDQTLAALPLPVGGLMSDRPIGEVRQGYDGVVMAARALGSELHDPFMAMSFKALEVIPKLKLTDQGLVDVEKFEVVDLFV